MKKIVLQTLLVLLVSIVGIMSVFIIGEVASSFEWGMVLLAFVGALFVAKPQFNSDAIPALLGLYGGFGAGTAYTFVRKLGKYAVKSDLIVFCFSAFSCIVTLPFAIFDYKHMTFLQILLLVVAGSCAAIAQFAITTAYKLAPAKEISVYDYFQVIFAAILGFAFLNQIPDIFSIIANKQRKIHIIRIHYFVKTDVVFNNQTPFYYLAPWYIHFCPNRPFDTIRQILVNIFIYIRTPV